MVYVLIIIGYYSSYAEDEDDEVDDVYTPISTNQQSKNADSQVKININILGLLNLYLCRGEYIKLSIFCNEKCSGVERINSNDHSFSNDL